MDCSRQEEHLGSIKGVDIVACQCYWAILTHMSCALLVPIETKFSRRCECSLQYLNIEMIVNSIAFDTFR